ncbi:hypothetical protein SEA_VERITY_38 [Gordonia phage Verity]|uniref:LtfC/p132/Gp6 beta-sandwich domain-containing protein n=1 Tax=Gordonia phage Verity TaxID=2591211 RepID=A0A514DIV3_9CAUD|nr:hypothetical protein J1776_gp38 [Gordonia phage Verity]QDH93524.1 hypothetical protein SEA_VERITY_38 [Gordonia phage Verity]QPO16881.1 hypothetical protein SEA_DELREY21_38 [Gordonia phage Delrey21]QXN74164.1 hypothetical protein SEA_DOCTORFROGGO_38 [Gordonia phage DoctorFroggo]
MTCAIGDPAGTQNVYLKLGGRFEQQLEFQDIDGSAWNPPPGTAITMVFGNPTTPIATWSATIDGNVATFERTVAQVTAAKTTLPNGTPVRILLTVPPDTEPTVETVGMVVWQ